MKKYQYREFVLTTLDDGTNYLSDHKLNNEISINYDENGDEYIIIHNQKIYLSEMEEIKHGGPREGAGRPKTGAMPSRTIRMTEQEYIKVKEYLKELRASQK